MFFLTKLRAKFEKFWSHKLSDKELARHLQVQVHSGTAPNKAWESKILNLIQTNRTNSSQIKKVIANPPSYIGGRWLHTKIKAF